MFDWFRKKKEESPFEPKVPAGNPGQGTKAQVAFAGAVNRSEEFDYVERLSAKLREHGIEHAARSGWLVLANGLALLPQFVTIAPTDRGAARTTTTISIWHPTQVPEGLFEYQHATGDTAVESVDSGFDGWIRCDLPALSEALLEEPKECSTLAFERPETAVIRRVTLGPTLHYMQRPDEQVAGEHDFCPCCLFTNSFDAFEPQLKGDGMFGVRLFATRGFEGEIEADCRVNGEDWPHGQELLIRYARGWPDRGTEFRKQYVVIRTVPGKL